MSEYTNDFVAHLNRYTTVSPDHEAAFDEFISQDIETPYSPLRIVTRTEEFVRERIGQGYPPSIILTGNAGDGKTYLCRRIIEAFAGSWKGWPDDEVIYEIERDGIVLNVVKDLSEVDEETGTEILERVAASLDDMNLREIFLIAANEGRLRAVLSCTGLDDLAKRVDRQLNDEPELDDSHLIVLNLNQVTTSSYVSQFIEWVTQVEHWSACDGCAVFELCPMRFNASKMENQIVRKQIAFLYRILEHLGIHLTIRDMLIHLSYVVTGGLTCKEVAIKNRDPQWRDNSRHRYVYYANLWGEKADETFREKIHVIHSLRKLDVADSSFFSVDEFIISGDETHEGNVPHEMLFSEAVDLNFRMFSQTKGEYLHGGTASPKPDQEHELIATWLPHCRRKLFFEWDVPALTRRLLPFLHLSTYFQILEKEEGASDITRDNLILGLNRSFTGLFISSNDGRSNLYITSQYAHSAEHPVPIVKARIPAYEIKLYVESEESMAFDRTMPMLILDVPPPSRHPGEPVRWKVSLLLFEYLLRRAQGGTPNVLSRECELSIRKFKDRLLASFGSSEDEDYIRFFAPFENRYVLRELQIKDNRISGN